MRAFGHRGWSLIIAAALALLLPASDRTWGQAAPGAGDKTPPPASPPRPPTAAADAAKPRLDMLRIPGDAVIVICKEAVEALAMVPDGFLLSASEYRKLLDELAQLREKLGAKKSVPPSRCQLVGKVEGGQVLFEAQFDFVTERPDAIVALACSPAVARSAKLDDHTPLFRPEGEGLSVQVDKPGEHQIKLELALPLTTRDGAPAIDLSLPRAAVTTLDLELPKGCTDLRIGGQLLARTLLTLKDTKLTGGLGPVDRLDITYKEARPLAAAPVSVATGRIVVRVGTDAVTTDAELALFPEAGMVGMWQLLVPRGAELRLAPEDQARLAGAIETADQPLGSLRTLRLREASAVPLKVSVIVRGPPPQAGKAFTVGPFTVVSAARQTGTLLVSNTVPELHLDLQPRAGLRRSGTASEEDRQAEPNLVAVFRYGGVAVDAAAKASTSSWYGPWIEVDTDSVRGQTKARVSHVLQLKANGQGGLLWQATTTIEAAPRWADVDTIKVQLPAGWVFDDEQDSPATTRADRTVVRRLNRGSGEAAQRVTVTLQGRYLQVQHSEGEVRLSLPRPLGVIDEGGDVTLRVDPELELLALAAPGRLEEVQAAPQEQIWRARTLPEAVSASWRPYVPDVRVQSIVDLDLTPQGADVKRHELRVRLPQPAPDQIILRTQPAIESLKVLEGGSLISAAPTRRFVRLEKGGGPERSLVLSYFVRGTMPSDKSKTASIPLVWAEPASQTDVRVRVWCNWRRLPAVSSTAAWRPSAIEAVPGRPSLPVLVAVTTRPDAPLVLQGTDTIDVSTVLVEHVIVRATIADDGTQAYIVRLRLQRLASDTLDIELPAPVRALALRARLDKRDVLPEVLDDSGRPSEAGRVARLRLSMDIAGTSSLLELRYQLSPGRALANAGDAGPLATLLVPPVVRDCPGPVPICWQVRVPAAWVVLSPESGPGVERTLAWRGRLPALQLRTPSLGPDAEEASPDEAAPLDVLCFHADVAPLLIAHVPQQAWLLACSLLCVVLGLVLLGLRTQESKGRWRGMIGFVLLAALAATAILRPAILAAILYGCEPAVVVLVVVLFVQWLLHERRRRQVVFLPNFSRKRSGSSLIPGAAPPGKREPSTVDHPQGAGNSASRH
jgi:hypothetical protein